MMKPRLNPIFQTRTTSKYFVALVLLLTLLAALTLAGTNPAWNTIRYLCPMCSAMGLPPIEVATGVVSGYWQHKGYGFIDNGGPRIFFHVSDLAGHFTPYVGMPVTCRVEQNDRGLVGRQVAPR